MFSRSAFPRRRGSRSPHGAPPRGMTTPASGVLLHGEVEDPALLGRIRYKRCGADDGDVPDPEITRSLRAHEFHAGLRRRGRACRRTLREELRRAVQGRRSPYPFVSLLRMLHAGPHYSIPCIPIATSSIADAAESRKIVTAQTTTNATIASGLVSR